MRISHRLEKHALAATVVALGAAAAANAAIVTWNANLVIPNNIDGLYINVVARTTGASGTSVSGWDINPYSGAANYMSFFSNGSFGAAYVNVSTSATTPSALSAGAVVGAASVFTFSGSPITGTTASNGWALNALNYFGFRFLNESTGVTNYGFGVMQMGANGGTRTLVSVSYEDSGASITVVPAPGAIALLGLAGFAGRRRR